jgi:hypothetical protein
MSVHSPRNQYGEEDPREREPAAPAPTAQNAELYELRKAVLEQGRALATPDEIKQIDASTEEQLKELWVNCYVNQIEPAISVNLEGMTPMRRAKVTYWRNFFVAMNVDMYRFKAQSMKLNLSKHICGAWEDILDIKEDDASN